MIYLKNVFFRTNLVQNVLLKYVKMDETNQQAVNIFLKSVEAVNPADLIKRAVRLNQYNLNEVLIGDKRFPVKKNCYLVGFGKAVFNMAVTIDNILCCHLVRGILSVPAGTLASDEARQIAQDNSRLQFIEGAVDNIPDEAAKEAAVQITQLVKTLTEGDLLIVLISGGGSALLPSPKAPVTLDEKAALIKQLSKKGANITELNCVRKRLSELKGGGLAELAFPADVVGLILSDVIDDPLDYIASGPTVPNNSAPDDAMKVIKKYALLKQLPEAVRTILVSKDESESLCKDPDGNFIHVTNYVIGNNKHAACHACAEARKFGYQARIISLCIDGNVSVISDAYVTLAVEIAKVMKGLSTIEDLQTKLQTLKGLNIPDKYMDELITLKLEPQKAICLVAGGEPTVKVTGKGQGGRNQQLALQFSINFDKIWSKLDASIQNMNIMLLSCGTDGIDGPTDAAGAVGFPKLCSRAKEAKLDPLKFIKNNDSYNFYQHFEDGKYLIKTGHTGTNVMDIHLLLIKDVTPVQEEGTKSEKKDEHKTKDKI